MINDKLQAILDAHKLWLTHEGGKRANLSGADLRRADLREADLRGADLSGADLSRANLSWANLSWADLREADLSGADLSRANLREADLSGADLSGANLDFACWPLWCGSLSAHLDDKHCKQIAYHLVKAGTQSKNTSEEVKAALRLLVPLANQFHRIEECGVIKEENNEYTT